MSEILYTGNPIANAGYLTSKIHAASESSLQGLKVFVGGLWTEKPLKMYIAGVWTTKPIKII